KDWWDCVSGCATTDRCAEIVTITVAAMGSLSVCDRVVESSGGLQQRPTRAPRLHRWRERRSRGRSRRPGEGPTPRARFRGPRRVARPCRGAADRALLLIEACRPDPFPDTA